MRLVDDDRVVRGEQRVALRLGEQDAVGHQLDERVGLRVVGEADLVADDGAELGRRAPARSASATARAAIRRGCVWPISPRSPRPFRQADLGQLRRLARAGLAAHDHDLMLADRPRDVGGALRHRQLRRIGDGRPARGAGLPALDRTRHRGGDPLPLGRRRVPAARALDPAPERDRVRGHPRARVARAGGTRATDGGHAVAGRVAGAPRQAGGPRAAARILPCAVVRRVMIAATGSGARPLARPVRPRSREETP